MIFGLAGNDVIDGGAGIDELFGNSDDDTYIVDSSGDLVYEWIGEGHDTVRTSATYVLRAGQEIEALETTNQLGDTALDLVGNEFGNTIIGNEGNNTIAGSPVDDGAGYDGLDIMIGNGGRDRFVWTSLAESRLAGIEADVIQDFTPGEDLIVISPIDADTSDADNDVFTFVGVVDFATSEFTGPGQIGYFTTPTDTYILLNTDGSRFEEMTIHLLGCYTVEASWFDL